MSNTPNKDALVEAIVKNIQDQVKRIDEVFKNSHITVADNHFLDSLNKKPVDEATMDRHSPEFLRQT